MNSTAARTASPAVATTGTPPAVRDAYARAYARAVAAKVIAYKNADGTYTVPSSSSNAEHTVRVEGRRWYDLSCTCAGGNHVACLHRAVVVHCRKYHVAAVRPAAGPRMADPMPDTYYMEPSYLRMRQGLR